MSLAGRTLSNFTIVEEINRRGTGVVHWATDTRIGRDVALKRLPQGPFKGWKDGDLDRDKAPEAARTPQ